LAAHLESVFSEETTLIQSSGGVFEVEDRGQLIFSKQKEHRFPEENEISSIVQSTEQGQGLQEAQIAASVNIPKPPTFFEWFLKKVSRS
jgi:selT/selW/selH-like putative selenoprotein